VHGAGCGTADCRTTGPGLAQMSQTTIVRAAGGAEQIAPVDLAGPPVRMRGSALAKRAFDIAVALAGLGLLLPLWGLIAVAIKLDDGGPVFYSQERVGRGGRRFRALKFRSMVPDAEARFGPRPATPDDPRVTRVGRWLRATAMDELPQLWNILRGDMSVVGPRALRPDEIDGEESDRAVPLEAIPGFAARAAVRPGLTGLAQIYAPRSLPRRQKFRYDRLYVERRSLWLDVRLILLSFWITLRGTWEVDGRKF
jgi:lipopolysaccharide/colanic/teichoic acid biosynthesis glycosyltransferase